MKFEIKNRITGVVQVTAEIECEESAPPSLKLGLAARWAVSKGANLAGANLARANMGRAYLADAYLADADLTRANLADADLTDADLTGANLAGADLTDADLTGANLAGANLADADLTGTNLAGANLADADLAVSCGNMREIKSAQFDTWALVWTADVLCIGCQRHSVSAWEAFTDEDIAAMDPKALAWWRKWKPTVMLLVKGGSNA